jgi:hypothetical protein
VIVNLPFQRGIENFLKCGIENRERDHSIQWAPTCIFLYMVHKDAKIIFSH